MTPESFVETVAWDQRFGRRFFFKAAYLHRDGTHAYALNPDAGLGQLALASSGTSNYWEVETTGRFLASEHRDVSVSYVRSRGTRDLNDYDQFFGNFRNPIIRANENSLSPTDVPNRLIVRGTIGLPGQWVTRLVRMALGIPLVGRGRVSGFRRLAKPGGAAPSVSTLDFTLARPWRFRKIASRRPRGVQPLRHWQRTRRSRQHHVARLRKILQPDRALDRVRRVHEPAVTVAVLSALSLLFSFRLSAFVLDR